MAQTMSRREEAHWCLDILIVEKDTEACSAVAELLEGVGHRVHVVTDALQALATMQVHSFDIVIADVEADELDGFSLLAKARAIAPAVHVILTAQAPSIEHAVAATRARADYLTKPLASKNLLGPVAAIARRHETQGHLRAERLMCKDGVDPIIGRSPLVRELKRDVEIIAQTDGAVLVCGESGTGKELVARMLHVSGPHADGPLVTINCAAFPESLLDAEIFGCERGAGGETRREGRLESAQGGTLFLDEVGELSPAAQAKLLRAIEQGSFERPGSNDTIKVNARIISATNRDLEAMVAKGQFRDDLLYRLKVFRIDVPPLRRRRDDLPLLVEYFCQKHSGPEASIPSLSPETWAVLASYPFRGNIRELEHAVRHALAFARGGDIEVQHLPAELRGAAPVPSSRPVPAGPVDGVVPLSSAVDAFEHQYLCRTLERTEGNRSRAASLLGISRKSLWAKLKRFEERQPGLTVAWRK
ncbi:MAG TPA: sigma-54 dependent transcriptional regulator [Kofleriaceae bacterium]|nr:sigma-54 dependent transcriptional regulator [Kofleriaceae bacterium]